MYIYICIYICIYMYICMEKSSCGLASNVLQWRKAKSYGTLQHTATHCNTLQHTATHLNTPQHTATHCNTLQHTATHRNTPQLTVTLCTKARSCEQTNRRTLDRYGVATISWLLKIICLLCKRGLETRRYSAKETYDFKEPTNRSHSIP